MSDQIIISLLLLLLVIFFIWGKFRYDAVALVMLSVFVVLGYVAPSNAFSGLGHPAVVTVALVLLISKGLEVSGFISIIGGKLEKVITSQFQFILIICFIVAILSSFMNNIGAMAMLLPITLGICKKMEWNPSKVLMPLAFSSILGGMNTKIGTPPNIIISEMRADYTSSSYNFFDFSYIGIPVCFFGILFIVFLGTKLITKRKEKESHSPLIELEDYLVEMTIEENSSLIDKRVNEFRSELDVDTSLMGYINEKETKSELHGNQKLLKGQTIIFKINPKDISDLQQKYKLKINSEKTSKSSDNYFGAIEAIIVPKSRIIGRKYKYFKRLLGDSFALLGLWRRGLKFRFRLSNETFQSGDVLLIANRGNTKKIGENLEIAGLMPLWKREFDILNKPSKAMLALSIFAISLLTIIFNILPIIVAFLLCILAYVSIKLLTGEGIYQHIDWPIVILLAAMIPIGNSLTEYGISENIGNYLSDYSANLNIFWMLIILMVITMFLSDIINNAATAVIMAPIAYNIAISTGNSVDAFLMAISIGASCAFLSPIGHQCNTLVMGPGNYKFGDYWKLGLPLEIVIILVSVPCIIYFWS